MSDQPENQSPGQFPAEEDRNNEEVGHGLRSFVRTLHILFIGLRVLIIVVIAGVLLNGVFYVQPQEKAMVFRFGKLVKKQGKEVLTSEDGRLYWAWPYPIDRVERIPAERTHSIQTDAFWPQQNPNKPRQEEGGPRAGLQVGTDGYVVTGDAYIMHMVWRITYEIRDVKDYYLNFYQREGGLLAREEAQNGEELVGPRAVIENVLVNEALKEVAGWPIEDVLVKFRREEVKNVQQALSDEVEARVRDHLNSLQTGVNVQQVSLRETQPPAAVHDAFRQVLNAAQTYKQRTDRAEQYKKKTLAEAEARRAEIVAEAKAYKTRTVQSMKAKAGYFKSVLRLGRQPEKSGPETRATGRED